MAVLGFNLTLFSLNIVIWDGALWFWSVIKTIMLNKKEYDVTAIAGLWRIPKFITSLEQKWSVLGQPVLRNWG